MTESPIPVDLRKDAIFSIADKRTIMRRQCNVFGVVRCAQCEMPIAEMEGNSWKSLHRFDFDHIRARELGGETSADNGQALCTGPGSCHRKKSREDLSAINWAKKRNGEFRSAQRVKREREGPSLKSNSSFRRWR